jgi:hypothetical protein
LALAIHTKIEAVPSSGSIIAFPDLQADSVSLKKKDFWNSFLERENNFFETLICTVQNAQKNFIFD